MKKLLFRNTGIQIVGQGVSVLVGVVLAALLSRYLGVDGYGRYNYIFAFSYLFLALEDLGMDVIVVRELSRRPESADRLLGAALTLKLTISFGVMLFAWFVISRLTFPPAFKQALFLYMLILPIRALESPKLFLIASLKVHVVSLIRVLNRLTELAVLVLIAALGFGLRAMVAGLVVTACVNLWVILRMSLKEVRPVLAVDREMWKNLVRWGAPIGLTGVFVTIMNRIDFVMLERMSGYEALGLYAASYKITDLLSGFPLIMMGTLYPLMSRFSEVVTDELRNIFKKSTVLLALAALPVGFGVTFLSPWIVRMLFGEHFSGASQILRILIWSTVFLYIAITAGNLLISIGRTGVSLAIAFGGALGNISLNFLLIPKWGAAGAAAATSVTYLYLLVAELGGACWFLFGRPALRRERGGA